MRMYPPEKGQWREVRYGSKLLRYELCQTPSRSLAITVYPNLEIRVKAPIERDASEIDARVKRRGAWIIKQLEYFRQYLPIPAERRYLSGETHFYLGRQYRLKITQTAGTGKVALKGNYITIEAPRKNDSNAVGILLDHWYRQRARELFRTHLAACSERMARYGIGEPYMRIQRMKRRWGSYTPSGTVILNLDLIKTPIHCIDYVIVHELCHAKENHHGPAFENLLTRVMPDWRKRKERLERSVIS